MHDQNTYPSNSAMTGSNSIRWSLQATMSSECSYSVMLWSGGLPASAPSKAAYAHL